MSFPGLRVLIYAVMEQRGEEKRRDLCPNVLTSDHFSC